ncbi:MAG: hypothetical protein E6I16_11265 [Chloroflexi bacterium]|nr:MAG: hypothetical protein E6I16_11265 [Chloroflexota bacterium]
MAANEAPSTSDPAVGKPSARREAEESTPTAAFIATTTISAAKVGAVISHRQRADELEPPGLLVAASEPADHEDAHKGDDDHPERADLEGDLPAESVETLRRTVERYGSGVVLGRRGGLIDRRLRREK